jgi:hypothetical protein
MSETKAIDADVTAALDRWAGAIGTPEHQAASEALDTLLVELCATRKRAPSDAPARCEHPYLNRIYVGEGDLTPNFDCQHCGTEFYLAGRHLSAANAGAEVTDEDMNVYSEASWAAYENDQNVPQRGRAAIRAGLQAVLSRRPPAAANAGGAETFTQKQIMDAIEQTVEVCARQWFKGKLPGEAWVVNYAGILAKAKERDVARESTTPAPTPTGQSVNDE